MEFGWSAHIEEYEVLLHQPISQKVQFRTLLGKDWQDVNLEEPPISEDPTSLLPNNTVTFNAYSASGNCEYQSAHCFSNCN
jgi:hypothetical protein